MKILLDSHALYKKRTGRERYTEFLVRLFSGKKDTGVVLYLNKSTDSKLHGSEKYIPLFDHGMWRITHGFYDAIKKTRPSIIHVNNFGPLFKTIPTITTVYDLCHKVCPETLRITDRLAFALLFNRTITNSDIILCISENVKKELMRFYKIDPKKIFVIYALADRKFHFIEDKIQVKRYLLKKFSINKKFFLVVGEVQARKRPIEIIHAFLSTRVSQEIQLVFVGPNKMREEIFSMFPDSINEGKIKFLEYVSDEDLVRLYNGAISLLFYSKYEGFGLPIIEAMACRVPVICSDIPIFRELAANSALFVKKETDLSDVIVKLSTSTKLRSEYAALSYRRGLTFSGRKAEQQTYALYKEILRFVLQTKSL